MSRRTNWPDAYYSLTSSYCISGKIGDGYGPECQGDDEVVSRRAERAGGGCFRVEKRTVFQVRNRTVHRGPARRTDGLTIDWSMPLS